MIRKVLKSSFVRNVAVLATGTAAAQVITLIASPVITRIYGPEAFGMMGVFMAVAQIFIPIAAFSYPIAIVLPKSDSNARNLIRLSVLISFAFSLFSLIILLLFNKSIVDIFRIEEISSYMFLIPIVILSAGLMQVSEQWLIRTKQFGISAKVSFLQAIINNASKIGIGFLYPIASVLIIINAFGNGMKAVLMFLFIRKSNYKPVEKKQEPRLSIKESAKKHIDFPLYRAPETLVNAVSQRFPVLMLTTFFGPAAAGFYTLGNNVLQRPIQLVGRSVGNVFYPRIAEAANNQESLSKLIIKATFSLMALGIVPFGIIIFFGPWIFTLIFGADWVVAGEYAQWIGIFLFCEFINKPSVKSLPVLSAQLFHLIFTVITLIVRVISLLVGYLWFDSDIVAIALFGISSAGMHTILILLVLKKSKDFDRRSLT